MRRKEVKRLRKGATAKGTLVKKATLSRVSDRFLLVNNHT